MIFLGFQTKSSNAEFSSNTPFLQRRGNFLIQWSGTVGLQKFAITLILTPVVAKVFVKITNVFCVTSGESFFSSPIIGNKVKVCKNELDKWETR